MWVPYIHFNLACIDVLLTLFLRGADRSDIDLGLTRGRIVGPGCLFINRTLPEIQKLQGTFSVSSMTPKYFRHMNLDCFIVQVVANDLLDMNKRKLRVSQQRISIRCIHSDHPEITYFCR
jgi:hypothetical protein